MLYIKTNDRKKLLYYVSLFCNCSLYHLIFTATMQTEILSNTPEIAWCKNSSFLKEMNSFCLANCLTWLGVNGHLSGYQISFKACSQWSPTYFITLVWFGLVFSSSVFRQGLNVDDIYLKKHVWEPFQFSWSPHLSSLCSWWYLILTQAMLQALDLVCLLKEKL